MEKEKDLENSIQMIEKHLRLTAHHRHFTVLPHHEKFQPARYATNYITVAIATSRIPFTSYLSVYDLASCFITPTDRYNFCRPRASFTTQFCKLYALRPAVAHKKGGHICPPDFRLVN